MDKLIRTASILDTIFKIAEILFKIAIVICAVCICIIAAGELFDLPDEMIGYVDQKLSFGPLTFHVAEAYTPALDGALIQGAVMCVLGAAACLVGSLCVRTIRAILAPMKEGKPFASEIGKNIRKLGWLSLVMCFTVQALEAISLFTMAAVQRIDQLFIGDKITKVEVVPSFDLSVLIIPAVFFLLAYIFRYGEQLQTLSDETL